MTDPGHSGLRGVPAERWPALYWIVDWATLPAGVDSARLVRDAVAGGVGIVQFRDKQPDVDLWVARAAPVRAVCGALGVPFIVNDCVEAVVRLGADGLHLGQEDMGIEEARARVGPEVLIGLSTHDVEQARDASARGADYIGLGAMFATAIKPERRPVGCGLLRAVAEAVSIPVYPIGGIGLSNVGLITAAGVRRCAVISAIMSAPDVRGAARALLERLISAEGSSEEHSVH